MLKKFIKLHHGLILFLYRELKKKRSPKELVYFLRDVAKQYIKIHVQEVQNLFKLFDPEYRKQKAEFEKHNKVKADLQRALKILQYIDRKMVKEGKSRQSIRQFWLDFTKNAQVRQDVLEGIEKEL
jgi:hypothetical protein